VVASWPSAERARPREPNPSLQRTRLRSPLNSISLGGRWLWPIVSDLRSPVSFLEVYLAWEGGLR
jgi:hypothetical protein